MARELRRKILNRRQRDVEAEYDYFNNQVKQSADYNIKKYIRDKERLREKNKTKSVSIVESESIVERIESSSGSKIPILISGSKSLSQSVRRGKENVKV